MHISKSRASNSFVIGAALVASLVVGGCPQSTFEVLLPATWLDGLKEVYDQRERFDQPAGGPPNIDDTWPLVDDISSLVGCWGSYYPNIAGDEEPVQIDDYSVLTLRDDKTYTWSHLEDFGGLFPQIFQTVGVYELVDGRWLRLTDTDLIDYNPLTQAYESFGEGAMGSFDYLVTLDGESLLLEVVASGESEPDAGVNGTIALRRFDCAG